jgi:peptide/nickel transport system substrate-binding protein
LRLVSVPDPNTVVANLLAGAAQIAVDDSLRFEQGYLLQNQWQDGTVIFSPSQVRWTHAQFRPELASPRGWLDVRFRRAVAHAIDKQALIDGLLHGMGTPADTFIVPQSAYFPASDRVITRYPLDPRRMDQLLNEAGYSKGSDGMYASPAEGKIELVVWAAQGTQNEGEITIMSDSFKRAGIDARPYALPQALALDAQAAANFPALHATSNINGFEPPIDRLRADRIPTPENRWTGNNRGSWNNPAFGALVNEFDVALARTERERLVAEMMRLLSDEVPGYPLYYNFGVVAHSKELQGIRQGASNWSWSLHEWAWQ